ncbi:PAS domain-containing protein [Roseibium algicola]|uniref:PAS domain-containing protein n=1 Tax=Roseibium algicola TaxID=2857014 RepID=A0ABM6IAW8_9HYPH|nr:MULTISPECIES: PAS domain-containing protein [Stappiaceae]MEC9421131.1 PAS domain-containing protein [Pseudomonadota bacterium]AQQ07643.1 PAS domain-containing protein [Roseibium aggregatum]MBO6857593.1 PAS domain-containing protein [Roseibium sp.]MBO9463152.1 PAS domain-containing protein [Labrenzia sp. R5_0]MEE2868480.1 PAS domain-containing protein [Pseudomonadota bacterium]
MKHGVTQTLYNYWDNLRGARPAPNRSEVDPGEIRGLLGDTFILETNGSRDVRYRLAGTRLCSAHCRELKGRNFLRGWSVKDREALESLIAAITEDAAAAVIGINGHTERGQILQMEMLLVPLNVPGEGRIRVLGSCTPMEKPYWIGLHPILSQSISSLRLVWPDERPYFVDSPASTLNPILPRFTAEGIAMPTPPLPSGAERKVGHLTVYSGGKT